MTKLIIALAQLNTCVGDIKGNLEKSLHAATEARDKLKADIIVFPELHITGYPPEDLLFRKAFLNAAATAVEEFIAKIKNIYCLISFPKMTAGKLYNACAMVYNGKILAGYDKQHLPNYGIFDERRYFVTGEYPCVVSVKDIPIGLVICEDLWNSKPMQQAAKLGARLVLVPNASPFEMNKHERRCSILAKQAKATDLPIVYVNCVGAQDEVIFDGGSMVVDQQGKICQFAGFFNEKIVPVQFDITSSSLEIQTAPLSIPPVEQRIYEALVLGVRDYLAKNNFKGALIGLSGGIDSALTLAIAVDALGKENVDAIFMPSRYTSDISKEDALTLIQNLDVHYEIISIEPMFNAFLTSLAPSFKNAPSDVTEENIQSRCRGIILMALSNKFGKMVLSTGNRSEMAVGYSTLYGDMCGGLAVLKDVTKTWVYRLAAYRNQINPIIPQRVIDRAPTAELAENQKDEDCLPPYSGLDQILELYINEEKSIAEIVAAGFDREMVKKVVSLINKSEYKRRQAPIGIRINHKAFGRDRRYPITSKFNE